MSTFELFTAQRFYRSLPSTLFVLGLLALVGCGGPAETGGTVSGKVTANGKPVTGADIQFRNIDLGTGITCTLQADGTFKSDTAIPEATYTIAFTPTLSDHQPGSTGMPTIPKLPASIPKKYTQTKTSDLTAEVKSIPVNEFEFDLK
ncbi:carboxypeptidase-like regulatory domain-containing protein [Bremerella cremea]|uniref:carboxypeptidase-like regulatory domain-containing protein n=1 Tax=Bremerella cremea TaxID=1031537 RepID=UPI0031F1B481